jgi:hypothetical protein
MGLPALRRKDETSLAGLKQLENSQRPIALIFGRIYPVA